MTTFLMINISFSGVTTRLQREQQARTGVQQLVRDANQPTEPVGSTTPPATSTPTCDASPSSTNSTTATTAPSVTSTSVLVASTNVGDFPAPPPSSSSEVIGMPSTVSTLSSAIVTSSTTSANSTATNSSLSISTSVISTSCSSSSTVATLLPSVAVSVSSSSGVSVAVSSDSIVPMDTSEDDKSKVKTFLGFGAVDDYQNSNKFFNTDMISGGNNSGIKDVSGDCTSTTGTTNMLLDGQVKTENKMEVVTIKKENESPQEIMRYVFIGINKSSIRTEFLLILIFGNTKTSQGAKSGEHSACSQTTRYGQVHCPGAISRTCFSIAPIVSYELSRIAAKTFK